MVSNSDRHSPTEAVIQGEILEYLRLRGVFAWRNNTGAAKIGGRFVRFGYPGAPDIIGILPGGRFLGIEVKTPAGTVSEKQDTFRDEAASSGGLVFTAYSVDCVGTWLDDILSPSTSKSTPREHRGQEHR
jgi:VRR-NUC domain.